MLKLLRRRISLQMLSFYVLFVIPVLLGGLGFYFFERHQLQKDAETADLGLAQAIALETETSVRAYAEVATALANSREARRLDLVDLNQTFSNQAHSHPDSSLYFLLDPNGIMQIMHPYNAQTIGQDYSYREYFQKARQSDQPFISDVRDSPTLGTLVVTVARRVTNDDGQTIGVVGINLSLEKRAANLAAIRKKLSKGDEVRIWIADGSGKVLADTEGIPPQTDLRDRLPSLPKALQGEPGNLIAQEQQREWLYSFVPVQGTRWAVIVQRPTDITFATINNFQIGLILALILLVLGASFFWFMLNRRVIGPLSRISQATTAIRLDSPATGLSNSMVGSERARLDEIGQLVTAFARMENEIHARYENIQLLLDSSRRLLATLDPQKVFDILLEKIQQATCWEGGLVLTSQNLTKTNPNILAQRGEILVLENATPDTTLFQEWENLLATEQLLYFENREALGSAGYAAIAAQLSKADFDSLLVLPLTGTPQTDAQINRVIFYGRNHPTLTPSQIALLENLSHQATMALKNAGLYQQSDTKLQEQVRILDAIMLSLEEGLLLESPNGEVVYANQRFCQGVGLTPPEMEAEILNGVTIRSRLESLLEQPDAYYQAVKGAESGGSRIFEFKIKGLYNNNAIFSPTRRDIRFKLFNVRNRTGQIIGRGKIYQDVTRQNEVERVKSNLLAVVSHELRTPLTVIKGYASGLLEPDVEWDAASQIHCLRQIVEETDRLAETVNSLLEMSQVEAGTLRLSTGLYSLPQLVREAASLSLPPAERERLVFDIAPDLPFLKVDGRRFRVVLRNLLENARRYGGNVGHIEIHARLETQREGGERGLLIAVQDSGPGIPVHLTERIFDRFYQVDNGRERQSSGVGLGLAICRGLITAHGGQIWAENRREAAGAVFQIWLPAALLQESNSKSIENLPPGIELALPHSV